MSRKYEVSYFRTTSKEGYQAFVREYTIRLYKRRNKELTQEYLERKINNCWCGHGGRYDIWYDDYKDLLSKEEIIKILENAGAEYKEITTEAIDL